MRTGFGRTVRFMAAMALAAWAGAAAAQAPEGAPVALTTAQARAIAQQALAEGKPAIAAAMSDAILAADPDDAEAHLVRAVVLRGTGNLDAAHESAVAAYRHATIPALRFDAAMLAADILARQERFTRSQFWLRRADQAAPDGERRAAAERAFRLVRDRNPLQVGLRFSLRPSNNVNNGAETLDVTVGGLPFRLDPSGQQLGGWESSAGVSLGYRLSQSETQRTDLLGEASFRKVWLDSDAATLAPAARDSDYDYGVVLGGVRHQRLIWPDLGPSSITGVFGQNWYGGNELARWGEIALGQTVQRSQVSALRFGLQARVEKRLDSGINDNRTLGLSVEYLRTLGDGAGYALGASLRDIRSDSATVDGTVLGVSGSRAFGRLGPVEPRLSISAEVRDYQKWAVTPGGREDRTLGLSLDVAWPEVSYFGFVPLATLTARRTWSDVDIYDRNELSLGLTAVSRF